MATIDVPASQGFMTIADEGLSAEETAVPAVAPGRVPWLRMASFATVGFAVVVVLALGVSHGSQQSAHPAATRDITAFVEDATANLRNLGGATMSPDSASPDCQKDFGGTIAKAVVRVGGAALKVVLSCGDETSSACKTAKDEAAKLEETMKDDCVKEDSTDVCQQSGDKMETVGVCIPKTCQNVDDLKALAIGDTHIQCGGGGSSDGPFGAILHKLHLPSFR
jgi:hypothetical protein